MRSLLLALPLVLLALPARAETLDSLALPALKAVETPMIGTATGGFVAMGSPGQYYLYATNGTSAGTTKVTSFPAQRLRLYGARPLFINRDLGADALCTVDGLVTSCANPAAVTEPGAPSLFPTAIRYPQISAVFPFAEGSVYVSVGAFTNGMAGGDRKLAHVGQFKVPAATSSVHVLIPGGDSSPTNATLLGVVSGSAIFQRSDEATSLRVYNGTALTTRTTVGAMTYIAAPRGASRLLAQASTTLYGITATADESLGAISSLRARSMFGSKVALLTDVTGKITVITTDGTAAATTRVVVPGNLGYGLLATTSKLYALVSDGVKLSIWTTDGVAAPTMVRTFEVGESAFLIGARGDSAYFGVTPIDGATTAMYRANAAGVTSIGSVPGRITPLFNALDVVESSATTNDAVVAGLQSGGLLFIRGDAVVTDAGPGDTAMDSVVMDTLDAKTDTSVADSAPDSTMADTAMPDTALDEGASDDSGSDANADSSPADTGVIDPVTPDEGGCGCRTAPRAANGSLALLALAALLTRRRR